MDKRCGRIAWILRSIGRIIMLVVVSILHALMHVKATTQRGAAMQCVDNDFFFASKPHFARFYEEVIILLVNAEPTMICSVLFSNHSSFLHHFEKY